MITRSPCAIDDELSLAVKARASARAQISVLSNAIVAHTRRIDQLLAERALHARCPDTPESLIQDEKGR